MRPLRTGRRIRVAASRTGTLPLIAAFAILSGAQTAQAQNISNNHTRIVSVALLQPVAQLISQPPMATYEKHLRGPDGDDHSSLYLTDFASGRNLKPTMTGGPIVLKYASAECGLELPGGRQFMAGMSGPIIDRASIIFPMEPLTWEETLKMVAEVKESFEDAGWAVNPQRKVEELTIEAFKMDSGPKSAIIGQWIECGNGPAIAEVTVMHYNSLSGGSFVPPRPSFQPSDNDGEDTFLIYANFTTYPRDLAQNITELVMARRSAEGLNPSYQQLPAKIWLDDPDWRPPNWDGGF